MPKLKKQRRFLTTGAATLLGFLLIILMSCKSSTSPEEQTGTIYVSNTSGATIDIHVDEVFKRTLENDSDTSFTVVDEGTYFLEAFKTGTEILVHYGEVRVYLGGEYSWYIEGPSTIVVTNNYGETLRIHINGNFLGSLDDSYSEQINKVTFGEHKIEAKKAASDEVVASITFDVEDAADYFWEIIKEE